MKMIYVIITTITLVITMVLVIGCKKNHDTNLGGGSNSDIKVTTYSPQNITGSTAVCGGDVIVTQGLTLTEIGVCWSTTPNPTVEDTHLSSEIWNEPFICTITNLEPNKTYYIKSYALRGLEYYYGEMKMFKTLDIQMPVVMTSDVVDVTAYSAVCGGVVVSYGNGIVSALGVCWSTDHNPTIEDAHTNEVLGLGNFTSIITNLSENTTYYVRAYVTNEIGTVYGEEKFFITEDTVHIIIDMSTRVQINTQTGHINYEYGDKVYIGNNGKYVGELVYSNGAFEGDLKACYLSMGEYLYVYFLGNVTPNEPLTIGSSDKCSVVITDQTVSLPLISCGRSHERFCGSGIYTTDFFQNKCALVKFIVTTPSNAPVCIKGLQNKVVVDFSSNMVLYDQDESGVIKLSQGGGTGVEKWAILLQQEALQVGSENSLYTEDMMYGGVRPEFPQIITNGFYTDGILLEITTPLSKH